MNGLFKVVLANSTDSSLVYSVIANGAEDAIKKGKARMRKDYEHMPIQRRGYVVESVECIGWEE